MQAMYPLLFDNENIEKECERLKGVPLMATFMRHLSENEEKLSGMDTSWAEGACPEWSTVTKSSPLIRKDEVVSY